MNLKYLFTLSGLLAVLVLASPRADAQLLQTFPSKGGYKTAVASAKTSVGADAILIFVGTFGNLEYQGQQVVFNTSDGTASLWGYTFYSPSTMQRKTIGVVRPLGIFTAFDLPDSLNGGLAQNPKEIDSTSAWYNSRDMVTKLPGDTAYARFRSKYDTLRPTVITLSDVAVGDSLDLPNGFPVDKPIWSLLWTGSGDSTMFCFVASVTGETFCQRVELPVGLVPHDATIGTAALSVVPNPASGRTRVVIDLPVGTTLARGVGLALYNERGEMVLDLAGSLVENDVRFAEFDAGVLPAGNYFCRATGADWSGVVGIAVAR